MDEHTRDPSVAPPPEGQSPSGWLPAEDRWEHDTLRRATIHGVRLFNAAEYHESHDCFEDEWFNYGHGTLEKDFLQGMVQVAAGAYKLVGFDNETGMEKLLTTGRGYLDEVPDDYYGVDVARLRRDVEAVLADPADLADWRISLDGDEPTADDADLEYAASLP
jgi:hypothetical protein